jgi:hypothetical protein
MSRLHDDVNRRANGRNPVPGYVRAGRGESLLPVERILERFGERVPLPRAATRLKCEGCGPVGAAAYLGELPEPP